MTTDGTYSGWYRVGERWFLFIDGTRDRVHVEHIHVEHLDDEEFRVEHYDPAGDLLTTVTLPLGDLRPVVKGHEKMDGDDHRLPSRPD